MKYLLGFVVAAVLASSAHADQDQDLDLDFEMLMENPQVQEMFEIWEDEFVSSSVSDVASRCAAVAGWAAVYLGQNHDVEPAQDALFLSVMMTFADVVIVGIQKGAEASVKRTNEITAEIDAISKEIQERFEEPEIVSGPVVMGEMVNCMRGVLYWSAQLIDEGLE